MNPMANSSSLLHFVIPHRVQEGIILVAAVTHVPTTALFIYSTTHPILLPLLENVHSEPLSHSLGISS